MATYVLPNIVTGQSITVQGNSLSDAQHNAAQATGVSDKQQQAGGTFGGEGGQGTAESGGSSKVSGNTTVSAPGQQTQNPGGGLDALLQAAQRGDKETFEKTLNEQIREWDQKYGLDLKQFDENVRQYTQNFGITAAGVTGQYNGAPTMQQQAQWAQLYGQGGAPTATQPTLAAQQQTYQQQLGLISQAAALQANPFRQQQVIGQMSNLLGGGGVASFAAPNTVAGVGVAGGNAQGGLGYLQQMIHDIRDPTANTASMTQVMAGIPTPNKLNSTEFLRAAPSTQNMVLQGMQEKWGLDPTDALNQIKATLPQFTAPTTVGTIKR